MRTTISAPLSSREAARLRAGDDVWITAQLLLLAVDEDGDAGQGEVILPATVDGQICCLAHERAGHDGSSRWQMAQIDAPAVDRMACAILAAGARACIARGPCSAALSYALRKYRGLYFAVEADWLQRVVSPRSIVVENGAFGRMAHAVFEIDGIPLTVTHDSRGRDQTAPT
jgi:tartrate dehydratase beta subunit/fumarate hydratase class I family protein